MTPLLPLKSAKLWTSSKGHQKIKKAIKLSLMTQIVNEKRSTCD